MQVVREISGYTRNFRVLALSATPGDNPEVNNHIQYIFLIFLTFKTFCCLSYLRIQFSLNRLSGLLYNETRLRRDLISTSNVHVQNSKVKFGRVII